MTEFGKMKMLLRAICLLSLTSCLLFFASAETENEKSGLKYGSKTGFARRYISARKGEGPRLRGDPGPELVAYEEGDHEPYPSGGKFPPQAQGIQGADRYVDDIEMLLSLNLRKPTFERPRLTPVEIERDERTPKGPGVSASPSLNHDTFDNMVDIEQDRRKPKGPGISTSPSLNYNRFGDMIDIEQDRRKPKGPGVSAFSSLDYNRFDDRVDIEQYRRKPKGPGITSPSLKYNRFGNMVDIEQYRRKPKGPRVSAFSSLNYNRFDDMVDIEQYRRKPKGPGITSPSLNYNRFGNMVDIEQDRRKPKGPGVSAFSSLNYDRFDDMVDIEQYRRKPKGPGISTSPSQNYNRFGNMIDIEQYKRKPKGPGVSALSSLNYDRFDDMEQYRRKPKEPGTMSASPSLSYDNIIVDIEQDRRKPKGPGVSASPYGRFVNIEPDRRKLTGTKMSASYLSNYGQVKYDQKLKGSPEVLPIAYANHGRYGQVEQDRRKPKGPGIRDYNNEVELEQDRRKPKGPGVMPHSYSRVDGPDASKQQQSVYPAHYYDWHQELADLDSSNYAPPQRPKGDYGKYMERIAEDMKYVMGSPHSAYEQGTAGQMAVPNVPVARFTDREMAWGTGMEHGSLSEQQGSFLPRQHPNEYSLQSPGYKPNRFIMPRQDNPEG